MCRSNSVTGWIKETSWNARGKLIYSQHTLDWIQFLFIQPMKCWKLSNATKLLSEFALCSEWVGKREITCRLVFLQDALVVFWKHIFPGFWNENDTKSFFWYLLFYPQFQMINNCKTHYKVVSTLFLWNYIPEFKNCGENGSNYEYDSSSLPDDVIYPIQWVTDHHDDIYTPLFKCCQDDDRY